MSDATLTRRVFATGARDDKTGHLSKTFTEEDVEGCILHQGVPVPNALAHAGLYAKYPHTALVPDVIHEDDELIDAQGNYYTVLATAERWHLDKFDGYNCQVEKIKDDWHADRPATSGTWHTDPSSIVTDIRYRMKFWLDSYIADVYEDNGATVATDVVMFAKPDYHLWREFWDEGTDVIAYVEQASCKTLPTHDHYPYAFEETATIKICAVNKPTITAARLVSDYEAAIRKVATDHPTGSIRRISAVTNTDEDLGFGVMFSRTLTIEYKRANDDYVPSYPRITWGPSAAPSGTWIFPNCVNVLPRGELKDAWIDIPSFWGTLPQGLGSKSLDVEFIIDLDVCNNSLTFKRPQTTTPKTDVTDYDIAIDIWHNSGSQAYQTLTWQLGGPSYQVRLSDDWYVDADNRLHLHFREYRATSASAQTYKQRLGIS